MKILSAPNKDFVYTYKITPGISKIKGGSKVFTDLSYPNEIIEKMRKNINISL